MKRNCYWCRRGPWIVTESLFLGSAFTAMWLHEWMMAAIAIVVVVIYEIAWRLSHRQRSTRADTAAPEATPAHPSDNVVLTTDDAEVAEELAGRLEARAADNGTGPLEQLVLRMEINTLRTWARGIRSKCLQDKSAPEAKP